MALFNNAQKRNLPRSNLMYGSGLYTFIVPTIAASGRKQYDFTTDTTYSSLPQFLPVDFIQVQNNGGTDIRVYINGDRSNSIFLENGLVIKSVDSPIYTLEIENQSTTTGTTNNAIQFTLQKLPPDTNSFLRKIAGIIGVV